MESAAQNSNAVENPKRDVPLACMFGTLGAAVIYILSTTVIQGIVPNAELAQSTGPVRPCLRARCSTRSSGRSSWRSPILACLGSLLGWQFTIAMTGKAAADERMFPAFFTKVNSMGAPVTGMIVLGVVQSALALMTISPTLSEQFSALVNLAVVTNVIPYIISLSALLVMMKAAASKRNGTRQPGDRLWRCSTARTPSTLRGDRGHGRHARDGHHLHHLGLHLESLQGLGLRSECPLNPNGPRRKHMSNNIILGWRRTAQRSPSCHSGQWLRARPSRAILSIAFATAARCASPICRTPGLSPRGARRVASSRVASRDTAWLSASESRRA